MGRIRLLLGVGELASLDAGDAVDPFDGRGVMCGGVVVLLVWSRSVGNGVQAHLAQRYFQLFLSIYMGKTTRNYRSWGSYDTKRPSCKLAISTQNYGTHF